MKPLSELLSLKGKSTLITGSAAGIGKAITNRFAEAGVDLIVVDFHEKQLNNLCNQLKKRNATVYRHLIKFISRDR